MSYGYVLRKYKLPKPEETRYKAMKQWREIVEQKKDEELLIDEFVVDDQPKTKGWFGNLKKQVLG